MKTAYELAMERLNKSSPGITLTSDQKKELAELDSKFAAKIAEREIFFKGEIEKAAASGESDKAGELQQQLIRERKALQSELEQAKDRVRSKA